MFQRNPKRFSRFLNKGLSNPGLISFMVLCLVLFLCLQGFFLLERKLRPPILSLAELKAHTLAQEAVNMAVMEKVVQNVLYQDLLSIKQNDQGKIVMVQINTVEINRLMVETTLAVQEALQTLGEEPIRVPLGEALDNYFLAAYGPKIKIRLLPAGRVNTRLLDTFEDAGINQVRHKIYLDVFTEVRIVIPFISKEVEVQTTVPLADAFYPGEVPGVVIDFQGGAFSPE